MDDSHDGEDTVIADENPYQSPEWAQRPHHDAVNVERQRFDVVDDLTTDDFGKVVQLATTGRNRLFLLAIGAWLAVVCVYSAMVAYQSYKLGRDEPAIFASFVAIFPLLALFWMIAMNRIRTRRIVDSIATRLQDSRQFADAAGYHVEGPKIEEFVDWSAYEGFRANDEMLVLYLTFPDIFQPVCRSALSDPSRWDELIALVNSKLPRR